MPKQVKRITALEQLRKELAERAPYTKAISDAVRAGDMAACEAAQQAMRERFPA